MNNRIRTSRRTFASLLGVGALAACDPAARKNRAQAGSPRAEAPPKITAEKLNKVDVLGQKVPPEEDEAEAPSAPAHDPEPAQLPRPTIYLQTLGEEFSEADTAFILRTLDVFFPHPVKRLPQRKLPAHAYYPPRRRYRAEKILAELESLVPSDAQVIVGLTAVDISTTKGPYEDWGILGLASIGGEECVISRFRAKRKARDERHTRIRLAKVVAHEVGHTLGLPHCPNHGCLMEDGKGSVFTTDHEYDFCDSCRRRVAADLNPRELDSIPWENPGIRWPMPG